MILMSRAIMAPPMLNSILRKARQVLGVVGVADRDRGASAVFGQARAANVTACAPSSDLVLRGVATARRQFFTVLARYSTTQDTGQRRRS
jgi:hypothetical protein